MEEEDFNPCEACPYDDNGCCCCIDDLPNDALCMVEYEEPEGIDDDCGFDPYCGCYTYDC